MFGMNEFGFVIVVIIFISFHYFIFVFIFYQWIGIQRESSKTSSSTTFLQILLGPRSYPGPMKMPLYVMNERIT